MSARRGTARGVGIVVVAVAVVVVVVVVVASASRRRSGPPYDPDSTAPDGARATVELLRAFDTDVHVRAGRPLDGDGAALVLERYLDEDAAAELRSFARRGGTVVLAVTSSRTPSLATHLDPEEPAVAGDCADALDGVQRLAGLSVTFRLQDGDRPLGCFLDGGASAIVQRDLGQGQLVVVGGPDVFTNRWLDDEDNAVLVTALLAGRGPVAFVQPVPLGTGEQTLFELLPAGFHRLLVELGIALVLFVWASARRLGRPVREPLLWPLPGTAHTEAVAQVLQRSGRQGPAATWLRRRARRTLADRYQLGRGAPVTEIAAAHADALGQPEQAATLVDLLDDGGVVDAAALLRLANATERVARADDAREREEPHGRR